MEKWISTKDYTQDGLQLNPKWHVPVEQEISFANELLFLHFQSALDLLLKICQDKIHTDAGELFFSVFQNFSTFHVWKHGGFWAILSRCKCTLCAFLICL